MADTEFRLLDANKEVVTMTTHYPKEQVHETFKTDESGSFTFPEKLQYGTYYLEETKAPEKYVPLTNRVAFTVDEQSYVTAGQLISPEKIPNKHKGTLPSTGGKGIYVYIGAGVVLLLIAGLYFARRKHSQI